MHHRSLCAALAVLAFALPCHGMSRKPIVTVRFHTEANARDGETFATPVDLRYQRRAAYMNRVPDFSEKQIKDILPFDAGDGTWGCMFRLDTQGRIRLESLSSEKRGSALVVFIGTKEGQHQVVDLLIDRPVTDGVITVPRGLTPLEVVALRKEFKEASGQRNGEPEKTPSRRQEPFDREWTDRGSGPAKASGRRGAPEPDLPRLAD
jgi:hypothetical protein